MQRNRAELPHYAGQLAPKSQAATMKLIDWYDLDIGYANRDLFLFVMRGGIEHQKVRLRRKGSCRSKKILFTPSLLILMEIDRMTRPLTHFYG